MTKELEKLSAEHTTVDMIDKHVTAIRETIGKKRVEDGEFIGLTKDEVRQALIEFLEWVRF